MPVRQLLMGCLGATFALACTETPYSFFQQPPPVGSGGLEATGGAPAASGGTSSGSGGSGGVVGSGGLGSGGSLGLGGAPAGDACESSVDPTRTAIQLRASSGLCVSVGGYAPLLGEEAFAVVLRECVGAVSQRWTLEEMEYGSLVFSSENVQLNLDVRFAASEDGTPAVLYTPHRLYNQRFVPLSEEGGSFKLSPLHTPDKCMSERAAGLELWPCDPAATDQTFDIITCDAITPPNAAP